MFNEEITVNKLSQKVSDLLAKFAELREENNAFRQELVTLKAQNEAKDIQITKLQESLKNKDMEADDIFGKIEEVLRR